jgi:hypothetical protein
VSQTRTVPSSEAEITREPSGENWIDLKGAVWPSRIFTVCRRRQSHAQALDASSKAERLEAQAFRESAVAVGKLELLKIVGITAL